MATILDDEDTVEAQALSTSLDPYGQLVKMLMPRALCIAIYDRMSMPLWLSDGCDGPDLLQLVEEALNSARSGDPDPAERDGFARSWDGDTAYVFILRDGQSLLGALAVSSRDTGSGGRPFSFMQGLLRPALQVLGRELLNHYSDEDASVEVEELADPAEEDPDAATDIVEQHAAAAEIPQLIDEVDSPLDAAESLEDDGENFEQMLGQCVERLRCSLGALLVPDKRIAVLYSGDAAASRANAELLEHTQRHLVAWAQVQRRTLMLNKVPPSSPLGALPYKILACPIRQGAQQVAGVLVLIRPMAAADFDLRQTRIAERLARRVSYILQSEYDSGSGLLTRPGFEQRALAVLAEAPEHSQHCVVYINVSRMHALNENHGMHVGDEAINRIAAEIHANLPSNVSGAHISGDRFALFLPDTRLNAVQEFVAELRTAITQLEFSHEGHVIPLSINCGIAALPATKLPLSHALAAAEVACKGAGSKVNGSARSEAQAHQEAQPHQEIEAHRHVAAAAVQRHDDTALIGDLRDAIANDRFRMEAQPIVQLARGATAKRYELLLRMIDASGESIAPEKFFSAAERNHLATDIDRWVLQYALEILSSAAPVLENLGAQFAINISGQSLGDDQFPTFLEDKLREYGLPPAMLSFEITETAAVANIVRAEMLVRRLRDLGHGIALDDFGRGLSSLSYLKSLPVSELKIDGPLVRDLAGNARSQATVTTIVQLAQSKRLQTVAECVESEAILAAVGQLGVNYGQGFAIGRPKALEGVLQELLRGASGMPTSGSPRMSRATG